MEKHFSLPSGRLKNLNRSGAFIVMEWEVQAIRKFSEVNAAATPAEPTGHWCCLSIFRTRIFCSKLWTTDDCSRISMIMAAFLYNLGGRLTFSFPCFRHLTVGGGSKFTSSPSSFGLSIYTKSERNIHEETITNPPYLTFSGFFWEHLRSPFMINQTEILEMKAVQISDTLAELCMLAMSSNRLEGTRKSITLKSTKSKSFSTFVFNSLLWADCLWVPADSVSKATQECPQWDYYHIKCDRYYSKAS